MSANGYKASQKAYAYTYCHGYGEELIEYLLLAHKIQNTRKDRKTSHYLSEELII